MADISEITIKDQTYEIKDKKAREWVTKSEEDVTKSLSKAEYYSKVSKVYAEGGNFPIDPEDSESNMSWEITGAMQYSDFANLAAETANNYAQKAKESADSIENMKSDLLSEIETKADIETVFEDISFVWTEFSYDADPEAYAEIRDTYITAASSYPITIHCAGEILGFTASAYKGDHYKLVVNGETVLLSSGNDVWTGEKDTYTLPPTLMKSDIIIELSVNTMTFSNMTRRVIKGISTKVSKDENGNIVGENDSAYGSAGLSWGQGVNKTGSKAFHITGFNGINGGAGFYYIDGTEDDAAVISDLISAGTVMWSLENDMHYDYAGKIISVSRENGFVKLGVLNFYSNQSGAAVITYDSNKTYSSTGAIYDYAPELGYGVKNGTAYLTIAGHPELGSIAWNNNGTAFGIDNIVQGEMGFGSGNTNKIVGNYGSAHGRDNIVGYDCHAFGRFNDLGFSQDSITAGYNNIITNFAKWNALFGQFLKSDKDFMAAFGSANRNLSDSVFEIGNGTGNINRHNIFSIDKNGLIQTNETYLPAQALIDKDINLNSSELVQGNTNALYMLKPYALNTPKLVSKNERYFGYVEVKASELNLTVNKLYIMFVHLNISNVEGTDPVSKTFVGQLKSGTPGDKGLDTKYINLNAGDNYIAMVFTPDGVYDRYGIYFDTTYNTKFTLTVKEVRVYELDESTGVNIPYGFLSASIDRPFYRNMYSNGLYGAIVQDVNLLKPYPILYREKLYAAHWDGVYNGDMRIYSTNDYLQGFEDRICAIDELLAEKSPKDHIHPLAQAVTDINLALYATATEGEVYEITENKIRGAGASVGINVTGNIVIDITTDTQAEIKINGVAHQFEYGGRFTFDGEITDPIEIYVSAGSVIFDRFARRTPKDGFMSAADKEALQDVQASLGDIDTALDAILAMQGAVIGGETA